MVDFELESGNSRAICEREFRHARSCTRSWSLRQLRKKHPKHSSINNMNDTNVNPSRPRLGNNLKLKLCLWNVRNIGNNDKLLSILGDVIVRRLNILVLTETLPPDGVRIQHISGPISEQRNIGSVWHLVCADEKSASLVVQF